jgi:hypothetical protein
VTRLFRQTAAPRTVSIRSAAKFLLALISIPAALILYTAANITGVGPLLCPWCFGFEHLERGLFVEAQASPAYRRKLLGWTHDSRQKIRGFFGSQQSDATIFACVTLPCYGRAERHGAQTLGISFLDWLIVLSPQIDSEVAITHELTHVELHNRLGPKMFEVPAWFDEGLAVNVSDDPRYLAPPSNDDRCLMEPAGPLPRTTFTWVRATQTTNQPYGEAACAVSRWLESNGGPGAVQKLIASINAGAPFAKAFH